MWTATLTLRQRRSNNDMLPHEILVQIFSYLSHKKIVQLMRICKRWRESATDPILYQYADLEYTSAIMSLAEEKADQDVPFTQWLWDDDWTERHGYWQSEMVRVQKREADRAEGRIKEVVLPKQTVFHMDWSLAYILTPKHGSNLVKIVVEGFKGPMNFREPIDDLSFCAHTLQILHLQKQSLTIRPQSQHSYSALRELKLDRCGILNDLALPYNLEVLSLVQTELLFSEKGLMISSVLPKLHTLELKKSSLSKVGLQLCLALLKLQHEHYKLPEVTDAEPPLSLAFVCLRDGVAPDPELYSVLHRYCMIDKLTFCSHRITNLHWSATLAYDDIVNLLVNCRNLEHLDLGNDLRVDPVDLENAIRQISQTLKSICLGAPDKTFIRVHRFWCGDHWDLKTV